MASREAAKPQLPDPSPSRRPRWGAALFGFYLVLVVASLAIAAITRPLTDHGFVYELGRSFALVGLSLLALQFVVTARLHWSEQGVGLDMVYRFHRVAAGLAAVLILCHPMLLVAGGARPELLYGFGLPWNIWLGRAALVLLMIQVGMSVWRPQLHVGFEQWRLLHNQATLIFGIAFAHAYVTGDDFGEAAMRGLWWGMVVVAATAYAYHRLALPWALARSPYRVAKVKQETHNVWTIEMEPPPGRKRFDFQPGQFHFLHFRRGRGLPAEEHHFTIASSPTHPFLASTIKEVGDFTATIGETRPGDAVAVRGPYGRFSYTYRPAEKDIVFIAGGIGITPIMSMLRHMRDTKSDCAALLLFANRTEGDIAFRRELEEIAAGGHPRLRVVHILSEPGEGWSGETGYMDKDKLSRYIAEGRERRMYYVCGPAPMIKLVMAALGELGVPRDRIEFERFVL